jgi:hypothetical protein
MEKRRPRIHQVLSVFITAGLTLAACFAQVGLGLPVPIAGESYPGERKDVTGVLEVASNGCLQLGVDGQRYFVIWPTGSMLDDRVRLPNGQVVREGQTVTGTGALTPSAPLVAQRDSYWASAIGFCAPDATEVLVLDSAALAG